VTLPRLLDRKAIGVELGVGRATVDAIFRALPVVSIDGLRKPMIRESDLLELLGRSTIRDGEAVR